MSNNADAHLYTVPAAIPYPIDLLDIHAAWPERYPVILESVAHSPQTRYDLLLGWPRYMLIQGDAAAVRASALPGVPQLSSCPDGFLTEFSRHWHAQRPIATPDSDLPFCGGWFVYLGYELAAEIEPKLHLPAYPGLPTALALRIPAAILQDHARRQIWLVAETPQLLDGLRADLAYARAVADPTVGASLVDAPTSTVHTRASTRASTRDAPTSTLAWDVEESDPAPFLASVAQIQTYIRAGDVFQVNLSRAWRARWARLNQATGLYRSLRRHNPAPFAALCRFAHWALLSSSPERLVSARYGQVQTRPIAGTHPRGQNASADRAASARLQAHPKEQAEHVMLIDLLRNDLGKLCVPGSIHVNELMALETYAHVHHLVSNLTGQLSAEVDPAAIIRALFPGGTITGCPKVRCMEIIAELEQTPRGPYTGSVGYVDHRGHMDLNILIRTLWAQDEHLHFRAGAGIVHDSEAQRELHETRAKAAGLLAALAEKRFNNT